MDPHTIVAAAIALLVPYAKKAAEAFAGEAGKTVYEKTKSLLGWISGKLVGDPVATDVVRRFESEPEKYEPLFQDILVERVANDSEFARELMAFIEQIKKMAPQVQVVQQMEKAENIVGARIKEMTRGTVSVQQDIKHATDVTGLKIDKM